MTPPILIHFCRLYPFLPVTSHDRILLFYEFLYRYICCVYSPVMDTRKTTAEKAPKMYPEFYISKVLTHFSSPPCQPPLGREVLERFFDLLFAQPKHRRDNNAAAYAVALELETWGQGDARIPLKSNKTLVKQIVDFRHDLKIVCDKSKAGRESYQKTVSKDAFLYLEDEKCNNFVIMIQ